MSKYWRLMGNYNGESQNYEALAGTLAASPFSPPVKGRLRGIRVMIGGEAASSLVEGVEIRLTCPIWSPNVIEVGGMGNGLRTVPTSGVQGSPNDFEVDQPVEPGQPITLEGRHNVATAVTNNTFVFGLFET